MRPVVWSIEAQRDNLEILRYIAEDNPFAAERVVDAIEDAGNKLGEMATGRPGRVSGSYEPKLIRARRKCCASSIGAKRTIRSRAPKRRGASFADRPHGYRSRRVDGRAIGLGGAAPPGRLAWNQRHDAGHRIAKVLAKALALVAEAAPGRGIDNGDRHRSGNARR